MSEAVPTSPGGTAPVIFKKAIAFAFGTIATVSTKDVTGAFGEADANDAVFFSPQAALTDGLVNGGARVSATGVVQCRIGNLTGGTLTPNTITLDVYIVKGGAGA